MSCRIRVCRTFCEKLVKWVLHQWQLDNSDLREMRQKSCVVRSRAHIREPSQWKDWIKTGRELKNDASFTVPLLASGWRIIYGSSFRAAFSGVSRAYVCAFCLPSIRYRRICSQHFNVIFIISISCIRIFRFLFKSGRNERHDHLCRWR